MSAQRKPKTKSAAKRQDGPRTENWREMGCSDPGNPHRVMGFLQLCADRRFHECIQRAFRDQAGLNSSRDYWIHADAGGTPKMEKQRTAPNYCYKKKGVRLMGWSAHGDGCGGFGEEVPDGIIRAELFRVWLMKIREYPLARHFVYFATKAKKGKKSVVYCMNYEKGK